MERNSQVLEVEIDDDGHPRRASYFIEDETIYANIGGRVLVTPKGPRPAADTVKTLLAGHLLQQKRKLRHMSLWRKA